ncbi:MAG: RNA-guided pseudouridylation complex pseudouridine synthase subunit Cbf5 [archaeon]
MPLTNEFLVRKAEESSAKYGCRPEERSLQKHLQFGVINLDKPAGPTSHEVADWVKKITGAKKAGHSGTLDPNVTGVLPTALNEATKILNALLPAGKEYVGTMRFHKDISLDALAPVVKEFTGTIMQMPPVRSAVKRQIRPRTVYSLDILETDGRTVLFRTSVEAGTYIRKLCHDIGEKLGGGNMTELRRTRAGPFLEKTAITLHDLKDAFETGETEIRKMVLPVEVASAHLSCIWIQDGAIEAVCSGAPLASVGITKLDKGIAPNEHVAIFSGKDELVALGLSLAGAEQIAVAKSGFAAKPTRVIMPSGTYPRMWRRPASK